MKIVNILTQAAEILGLVKESKTLATVTEQEEQQLLENDEIAGLFNLMKYSIQELCTNYVPMLTSVEAEIENHVYPIKELTNYISIQNVTKNNESVRFKIINRNIVFEENGKHLIQYATYPEIKSMFEELDFLSNFSPDVIVLGLAAYYALSRGRFEEFELFHEQYLEKAESLKQLKAFNLPQRRWE